MNGSVEGVIGDVCCQAEAGMFNFFHVCVVPFPALTFQNMVYLFLRTAQGSCSQSSPKPRVAEGKLGNGGAHWRCCSWEGAALGGAVLMLLREGGRSSFRNRSELSGGHPISKVAALRVVRQWTVIMSSPFNVCHCSENMFPGFFK